MVESMECVDDIGTTELFKTHPERLERMGTSIGNRVRVVSVASPVDIGRVGTEARLERADTGDARLTFYVKFDDEQYLWVHDVAEITSVVPVTEPEVTVSSELAEARRSLLSANQQIASLEGIVSGYRIQQRNFAEQVRDVAIRVAESEGWCDDGLNEVLEELGLEPKRAKEYRIEVTVRYVLTGRPTVANADSVTEDWVSNSVKIGEDIRLDDDWDECDVNSAEVESVSYEETD